MPGRVNESEGEETEEQKRAEVSRGIVDQEGDPLLVAAAAGRAGENDQTRKRG